MPGQRLAPAAPLHALRHRGVVAAPAAQPRAGGSHGRPRPRCGKALHGAAPSPPPQSPATPHPAAPRLRAPPLPLPPPATPLPPPLPPPPCTPPRPAGLVPLHHAHALPRAAAVVGLARGGARHGLRAERGHGGAEAAQRLRHHQAAPAPLRFRHGRGWGCGLRGRASRAARAWGAAVGSSALEVAGGACLPSPAGTAAHARTRYLPLCLRRLPPWPRHRPTSPFPPSAGSAASPPPAEPPRL